MNLFYVGLAVILALAIIVLYWGRNKPVQPQVTTRASNSDQSVMGRFSRRRFYNSRLQVWDRHEGKWMYLAEVAPSECPTSYELLDMPESMCIGAHPKTGVVTSPVCEATELCIKSDSPSYGSSNYESTPVSSGDSSPSYTSDTSSTFGD